MSAVVLLDQSAAFDLVDHGTLTAKMKALNFSHETVTWFENYLAERRFSCQVEFKLSNPLAVGDQRVPQGSILGSLLFIVSQGDLPDSWEECDPQQTAMAPVNPPDEATLMYVDDATEIVY